MCGILVIVNPQISFNDAEQGFMLGVNRGPDDSRFMEVDSNVWMGFHRLAINGLDAVSGQPLVRNNLYLVCNGEVYNHRELMRSMNVAPTTRSDCEVILHLYERYGIEQTVHMIDASEFAFVLYDAGKNTVFTARDPYGVRPLMKAVRGTQLMFGSEMKMMPDNATYTPQSPGTIETYVDGQFQTSFTFSTPPGIQTTVPDVPRNVVRASLYEAVRKRVLNTDRPMACLLSGGLDSSIITALVQRVRIELGYTDPLETYSIGLEGAEDLKYAADMAAFLGTKHTSVVMTEKDFFNAIPEVIHAIESYDTTTVRASVGNYLVAQHIARHSDAKVIFNGDGSDELAGGYLYFHYAPDAISKDQECRRLLKDIHLFDALRSDKCIASNGLEARTPFLDRSFVQTYLSLPLKARFPAQCEKFLLRTAFEDLLPPHICWRTKEAFSDGVSSLNRSWYQIITEMIPNDTIKAFVTNTNPVQINPPATAEQFYYRSLYRYDPSVIPYFWMPRFVKQNDCSARTLSVYNVIN